MPHGETGLDRPVCTPRRVRISLNWLVMMSMTRPKRILRARASPASASLLDIGQSLAGSQQIGDQIAPLKSGDTDL
jgi:hypothetical protein